MPEDGFGGARPTPAAWQRRLRWGASGPAMLGAELRRRVLRTVRADPDVMLYAARVSVWARWLGWLVGVFQLAYRPGLWYAADVVRTHSNPRKRTDREASWGVGHTTQAKTSDNLKWVFGYKLHMVADANYGIPLAQFVTTGSRHDSQELPRLIDHAKGLYDWFGPNVAIADRGYDSAANHQALWFGHGIIPIIHIRKPSNADLYQGIYTKEGVPTCLGMVPMEYVGTDRQGRRVYRCRKEGCDLKDSMKGGVRHCDITYRQDPKEDIRLFGVVRRSSRRWKALYRKRQAVERVFKSVKESRRLERHCLRGLRQITLHALMSCLAFRQRRLRGCRRAKLQGCGGWSGR